MKKENLVEWILVNGKYLLTVRDDTFKINLYQVNKDYWEIYFNLKLNTITRVGKVTACGLVKFLL
jgi:hypothetical protein